MSDYLTRVAGRALGVAAVLRPRVASRFEDPVPAGDDVVEREPPAPGAPPTPARGDAAARDARADDRSDTAPSVAARSASARRRHAPAGDASDPGGDRAPAHAETGARDLPRAPASGDGATSPLESAEDARSDAEVTAPRARHDDGAPGPRDAAAPTRSSGPALAAASRAA
ncbi:MAG TPA: hypothetical protein VHJ34_07875, partial [Actinomycetota bacterium]|nr:hypothetical protein [Actinomycetota bacterium]